MSPIIPLVVSDFSATPAAALAWNPTSESGGSISEYSIERCSGVACFSFSQIATTPSTSYVDTSAATGASYNYRVRAQDANGFYGPYSAVATAVTPAYFDNAADGGNNGGATTSLTYSYSVGANANRLLMVNIVGDTAADDISSVTYAGMSMTLLAKVQTPSDRWHYLYYLLAPPSGTNTVGITASTAHYLISEAASWYNVEQSAPVAFTTNTAASGVSITTSLPASPNNVVVAESIWAYTGVLPDNGSASLVTDAAFDALGFFASVPSPVSGTFPASMTHTWGGQDTASTIMASFALASNGTPGIAYDNSVDGGNNNNTTLSLTYPYKVGTGSNRLLVVNLVGDSAVDDIISVTYAGAPSILLGGSAFSQQQLAIPVLPSQSRQRGQQCGRYGGQPALSHVRGGFMVQCKAIGSAGFDHHEHGPDGKYLDDNITNDGDRWFARRARAVVLWASGRRCGSNSDTRRCSHRRSRNLRKQWIAGFTPR